MKNLIFFFLSVVFFFSSCQKRVWNNPFDPECPKESWTPTDFAAKQQGNAINLTWVQKVKNISGFRIERKIEGETAWKEVVSPEKATNLWVDQNITGGKLYEYRIVALAGGNESNFANVQIKPLLSATLTTAVPSAITATSAILGGTITTDGGAAVTERGVVFSTSPNPTTSNTKLAIGTGTGSFSNSISGLTANTTYYVRAYAINSQGIAYGNEQTFKTSLTLSLASLTTSTPTDKTSNSATLGGNITTDGNAIVTERGVCYNTSPNPTTSSMKVANGAGTGSFSNAITGLTANTTYYVRAYAINSQGTAYGNEVILKTFNLNTVTDIDGNVYNTVTIGTQTWMVENLKVTKYNDGASIPNTTWAGLTNGAYCWYNNDFATYKATYGALYNWYAVNTGKLAPKGWHVPTDAEWTTLTNYLGGESFAGGKLKESGTSHWASPNAGATNEIGFTAIPAGYRYYHGTFDRIGYEGNWWSSTEYGAIYAWYRFVGVEYSGVLRSNLGKGYGYSVRCIKGEPIIAATIPTLTTVSETNITSSSAVLGGTITTDGGFSITVKGVCWSTSPDPTITNSKTTDGSGSGSFTSNITGLAANTIYYVRAYATNSQGTAYGNEVSFKTLPGGTVGTVTDIDGNVYITVKIGSQEWMVENLKTTKYNDGTAIPNVTENSAWAGLTTGAYCWYNNDAAIYKATSGALYNWYAVNTGKLAPEGWHVPTDAEWTTLTTYLGGASVAGGKLKESGTSHWISPNTGGTNEVGFTALPCGARVLDIIFYYNGNRSYFWSYSENNTGNAWGCGLYYDLSTLGRNYYNKQFGFSVRCVKD